MSFLEVLDVLNERLTLQGEDPIAFDSDCREGICGTCGVVINGVAHGPQQTTTCQLHMRSFSDGDVIDVEPWRADPFPVIKDLVVDRSAFDRIIQAGGYISAPTAPLQMPTPPRCPNGMSTVHSTRRPASAAAPASPRAPTARQCCSPPRRSPILACCRKVSRSATPGWSASVAQHDAGGFGGCTNIGECTAVCPEGDSTGNDLQA